MDDYSFYKNEDFRIAIGNNKIRKDISEKLNVNYPALVHPTSTISTFSKVEAGTVVMVQSSINALTNVGEHCIINASAIIGHDVTIGDHVHVATNSAITGFINI